MAGLHLFQALNWGKSAIGGLAVIYPRIETGILSRGIFRAPTLPGLF